MRLPAGIPILPFLLLWTAFTVPFDAAAAAAADTSSSSGGDDGVSDKNHINTAASAASVQQQQQQHDTCFGEAQPIRDRGYHHNCDLNSFTDYKATLKKNLVQRRLTKTGIHNVPDEKTVICPDSVNTTMLVEEDMIIGQDTMWFVENTALTPVVVSWVDWKHSNREYSAVHREVYPAQSDPDTILYPGQWKAIHAFEGDIFYVREMIASGGGSSGPLMLQHRVGLTPIYDAQTRKRMLLLEAANRALGSKIDDNDINRIDELIKAYGNDQRNLPIIENQDSERAIDINYDWKTCNVVDIGFRNYAKRPLNVYWLERHNNNYHDDNNNNNNDGDGSYCTEQYKFHIGLNKRPTNFAFDFKSNTKYEKSYIGHTFVFRSSLSGKWVATHTIKPTQVNDCPNKKRTSSEEVVILPNHIQESIMIRKEGQQQQNITSTENSDDDVVVEFNEYATKEELDYYLQSTNNNNNNVSTTIMTIIPMAVSSAEEASKNSRVVPY